MARKIVLGEAMRLHDQFWHGFLASSWWLIWVMP